MKTKKIIALLCAFLLVFAPVASAYYTEGGSDVNSTSITWEGATEDAYETTLSVTDPTADRAIVLPNNSGTVALGTPWTSSLEMEGDTANAHETTIFATDPTADVTYTLATGTASTVGVMATSLATNFPAAASSVTGGTNQLIFEGAGVDAHEAIITATDPTADIIWTLPDGAADTLAIMGSTLATNYPEIANSVTGGTNQLIFEGTLDAHETIVTAVDATADRTATLPDASGVVKVTQAVLSTDNLALALADCGSVHMIATDAKTYTLPDTTAVGAGCEYTFINTGADDAVLLTVDPIAGDAIFGTIAAVILTGTDNGDLTNTKAGANKGDYAKIVSDGVDGWAVIGGDGVWAGA